MFSVDSCPKNRTEVEEAGKRLGCGQDEYGNNQYICLPNVEKTSLVEFCHNQSMGIIPSGNCMETSQGNVTLENCEHFYRGCPETNIWKYEFYRYPACQSINRKLRCYLLDPSCPLVDCENGDKSMATPSNGVLVAFLVLSIITIIAMLLYHLSKRRRKRRRKNVAKMSFAS